MHLKPFKYYAPSTLTEALGLLAKGNSRPIPLAGGTDLTVLMKEGKIAPSAVMSLKRIDELRGVDCAARICRIGAGVTISALGESELPKCNPCIADAVWQMATPQVRNRATIGGNLCTSAPCADFPPVLLVNDAVVELRSASGARELPLGEFFTGLRQVDRHDDELLVSVACRLVNTGSAYVKFGVRRTANIAVVGVACSLEVDCDTVSGLKVATTAACPMCGLIEEAGRAALGERANDATWAKVAGIVREHLSPISDLRGSAEYRLHLAEVGTVRALLLAHERLEGAVRA